MRKTDKKMENQLRAGLTDVCEAALEEIDGFQWLTHLVNYSNFPKSLKVVCVFDTNESLSRYLSKDDGKALQSLVQEKIARIGLKIDDISKHLVFDTEEECKNNHNGNWNERFG